MPTVSISFGIVIRMCHDEHPPPHFHASYQGFTAFVAVPDGEVVHGTLPKKAARLVKQWALDHQDALGKLVTGRSASAHGIDTGSRCR